MTSQHQTPVKADVVIVGGGLAGLVAAREAVARGLHVVIIDQENEHNLGGQAWWSFGGLFLVDSPEQRRWGIKDSFELAWRDWQGSAQWDRFNDGQDTWSAQWGHAYVTWAATTKREYVRAAGIRFTPVVGWAERGDLNGAGHGNSVPRFHIPWGTGTGVASPFIDWARGEHAGSTSPIPGNSVDNSASAGGGGATGSVATGTAGSVAVGAAAAAARSGKRGSLRLCFRHRMDRIEMTNGRVSGVSGSLLAPSMTARGVESNREVVGEFSIEAPNVVVATGGIGGNHELVRQWWPERLGKAPAHMITGVPAYVDGSGVEAAGAAGARLVNRDRMWHYTEGVKNWNPIWPQHAIRILPGPSPLWIDALGRRLPPPGLPGHDTLGTLKLLRTGEAALYDHSWFIVSEKIAAKEFALSGSEQNPDLTHRDKKLLLKTRLGKGLPGPVEAFVNHSPEWIRADNLGQLVAAMNATTPEVQLDVATVRASVAERDSAVTAVFGKDAQGMSVRNSRGYLGDRIARTTSPHRLEDPSAGGLIAIKLWILTRKSLGGIQTDLSGRALGEDGQPIPGLFACGEAAGFGGGGVHGYNALEGTFLGGCLFSGMTVGRNIG